MRGWLYAHAVQYQSRVNVVVLFSAHHLGCVSIVQFPFVTYCHLNLLVYIPLSHFRHGMQYDQSMQQPRKWTEEMKNL